MQQVVHIGRKWFGGIVVTCVVLLLMKALEQTPLAVPNPGPIYMLAVVYAAYSCGLWAGLAAAALVVLSGSIFFSPDGNPSHLAGENARKVIVLSITTVTAAILVGLLQQRSKLQHQERINQSQMQLEQERQRAAAVVDISEARFRTLCEFAPLGILACDVGGRCNYANTAWTKMSGLSAEQSLDFGWIEAVHPDDRESVLESWRQAVEHKAVWIHEHRLLTPDGQIRWVQVRAAPFSDREGQVVAFVRTINDITAHKRAEAVLRQSQEELERRVEQRTAILKRVNDSLLAEIRERERTEEKLRISEARLADALRLGRMGNWDWNLITDELHWSDEIYRIFGLEPSHFGATLQAFLAYVHPDDRPNVERAVKAALRGGATYQIDHRIIRPDGEERVVQERAVVEHRADGEPIRMYGTVQDITESHRTSLALRILDQAIKASISAIVVCDTNDRITFVNAAYLQMWGYDDESQVLGRPCMEMWNNPEQAHAIKAAVISEGMWIGESTARRRDGSTFQSHIAASLVHDEAGRVVGKVASFLDITDRIRAEERIRRQMFELEHASRLTMAGQMAAAMAHELDQPLGAAANFVMAASLALREGKPASQSELSLLNDAIGEVLRAGEIVRRTLAFVRRATPDRKPVDLNEVLEQAIMLMKAEACYRRIRLQFTPMSDQAMVDADAVQIQQVVCNLIRNAIDAIDLAQCEQREVSVSLHRNQLGHTVVTVCDTGPGLPPDIRQDLFEAFRSHKPNGLGLGLWISQNIVQAHGGEMTTREVDGCGACFEFWLPAMRNTADQTPKSEHASRIQPRIQPLPSAKQREE